MTPGNNIYTLLITFIAFSSFISSNFQTLFFPYKLSDYAWDTCVFPCHCTLRYKQATFGYQNIENCISFPSQVEQTVRTDAAASQWGKVASPFTCLVKKTVKPQGPAQCVCNRLLCSYQCYARGGWGCDQRIGWGLWSKMKIWGQTSQPLG